MLASVYIKDGNIHFYNENDSLSNIGGMAYELGRPLLDFVCYEPEQFDDAFGTMASSYDHDFAYRAATEPDYVAEVNQQMGEFQKQEIYVFFYYQMFVKFVYAFIESPRDAIRRLAETLPGAEERLQWTADFEWPVSSELLKVVFFDKERRLFRAAKDVVALMSEDLRAAQEATTYEIELLMLLRKERPDLSSMEYLFLQDTLNKNRGGGYHFLEKPFQTFYGAVRPGEIAELYEINSIKDLLRFEFIKMTQHDIFIKQCKNCGRFFIPRRRMDAEYCDRAFGDNGRKCSEIGATLRYEKKVAGNPILEAHKKAYRRFNSRTRAGKMTQTEFMAWSDEAAKKRDACLAGDLPFEEFVAWLEQGRIRRSRSTPAPTKDVDS